MTRALSLLGAAARLIRALRLGSALRLVRDALDAIFVRARYPPLRVKQNGFVLHGFLRHRSFLASVAGGNYETYMRSLFGRALGDGTMVVDGGAHIGMYTIAAFRRVAPTGRVIAFEPDPYNFAALSFNVARNRCSGVTLVPKALSDRQGEQAFQQNLGTISSSLSERRDAGAFTRRISVETTTLDDELADLKIGSLVVKLDVEGGELPALRGMRRTAQRAESMTIFVEVNPSALEQAGWTPRDLIAELDALHLTARFIDAQRERLVEVGPGAELRKGNLHATRERPLTVVRTAQGRPQTSSTNARATRLTS